jgi:hypothetical protein
MEIDLERISRIRVLRSEARQRVLVDANRELANAAKEVERIALSKNSACSTLAHLVPAMVARLQGDSVHAHDLVDLESNQNALRSRVAELALTLARAIMVKEDTQRLVQSARADYLAAQRAVERLNALAETASKREQRRCELIAELGD